VLLKTSNERSDDFK